MPFIWHPDFCTTSPGCAFETTDAQASLVRVIRYCPHHQSLRTGGLTDAQVFDAVKQSSRVKEAARWTVKTQRGLAENVSVPYTVGADGNFTIQAGVSGGALTTLRTAVTTAVNAVSRPAGTSTVTVAT